MLTPTLDTLASLDTTGTSLPREKPKPKLMHTLQPRLLMVFLMPMLWRLPTMLLSPLPPTATLSPLPPTATLSPLPPTATLSLLPLMPLLPFPMPPDILVTLDTDMVLGALFGCSC